MAEHLIVAGGITSGIKSFIDAYIKAKEARIKCLDFRYELANKPDVLYRAANQVKLQCPNCAAPNENYTSNCEYCNTPLRIL